VTATATTFNNNVNPNSPSIAQDEAVNLFSTENSRLDRDLLQTIRSSGAAKGSLIDVSGIRADPSPTR